MPEDKTVYDHINLLNPVYPLDLVEQHFIKYMKDNAVIFPKEHEDVFKNALRGNETAIDKMHKVALKYCDDKYIISTICVGLASVGDGWAALELGKARSQRGNFHGAKQIFEEITTRLSYSDKLYEGYIMARAGQEIDKVNEKISKLVLHDGVCEKPIDLCAIIKARSNLTH